MKNFLILFSLSLLIFSCKKEMADNDWGKMNLNGKVKSIAEADYFLDTTGSNKGKRLRWTRIYLFNTSGNLTHLVELNEKNDTDLVTIYDHDALGRLKSESKFAGAISDGAMKAVQTYFYDSMGNNTGAILRTGINAGTKDGGIIKNIKSKFNRQRQLVQITTFLAPDPITMDIDSTVEQITYNGSGNKIKSKWTGTNGRVVNTNYAYDDNNNCISEQMDTALANGIIKIIRNFDKEGNTILEVSYEKGNVLRSKKKIEYLNPDTQGNWTGQRIHWHDFGTTILERRIVYFK